MLPYASNLSYATLGQTYPMPPYTGPALCCPMLDLPYAGNLPYTTLRRQPTYSDNLPNSKFLVRLWVTSGHDPLHTFAKPSGAWEAPF